MKIDNYIKGICYEFADKDELLHEDELAALKEKCIKENDMKEYEEALGSIENFKLHAVCLDEFVQRDDIFKRWHDCGVNHLFVHIKILRNRRSPDNITSQRVTSLDCDNSEEYYLRALFEKCHQYGITPAIKIMTHSNLSVEFVNANKSLFFYQYKNIIDYLLSCDKNRYTDMITITNEATLIRKYAGFKNEWQDIIDHIHKTFPKVKVSASQFCHDITTGEYDIADILDVVGINRYPRNTSWPDRPSVEEMLPEMFNDADIYRTQQFCKNHNKQFIITECGVCHWSGQCREPEMGNSMNNFYGSGYDFDMQAAYTEASLIASQEMDYCIGHNIICGADYDPIFVYNYNQPLKGAVVDNTVGFEAIKRVWGEK